MQRRRRRQYTECTHFRTTLPHTKIKHVSAVKKHESLPEKTDRIERERESERSNSRGQTKRAVFVCSVLYKVVYISSLLVCTVTRSLLLQTCVDDDAGKMPGQSRSLLAYERLGRVSKAGPGWVRDLAHRSLIDCGSSGRRQS